MVSKTLVASLHLDIKCKDVNHRLIVGVNNLSNYIKNLSENVELNKELRYQTTNVTV